MFNDRWFDLNFSSWNHKILCNNKIAIWWQQKISKTSSCRKTAGLQNSSYFFVLVNTNARVWITFEFALGSFKTCASKTSYCFFNIAQTFYLRLCLNSVPGYRLRVSISTCFGSVLKRDSCGCTSELPNPVMSLRAVLSTLLTKLK